MEMPPQCRLLLLPPEHLWGGVSVPQSPLKETRASKARGCPALTQVVSPLVVPGKAQG